MGVKYDELINKVRTNKGAMVGKYRAHRWNYAEPYKMIITDIKELENDKLQFTVGFYADKELIEKNFSFHTVGNAAMFYDRFIEEAFPTAMDDMSLDMLLGRPFVAEIIKNDGFDNIRILSAYPGDFPDEVEVLE